jgi:hypothetical protein
MSREVRRVPADWVHPKLNDGYGEYYHDGTPRLRGLNTDFSKRLADWKNEKDHWEAGNYPSYISEESRQDAMAGRLSFEEYYGDAPKRQDYMPEWTPEEATHFQMYETCSEGTPISPVMETPEALALWLAANGASSFGSSTATYDQWLATIKAGWAPSAIISNGVFRSGVECSS